jgi:hypothetical protein
MSRLPTWAHGIQRRLRGGGPSRTEALWRVPGHTRPCPPLRPHTRPCSMCVGCKVCCMLYVACCMLHIVCCILYIACCVLCGVPCVSQPPVRSSRQHLARDAGPVELARVKQPVTDRPVPVQTWAGVSPVPVQTWARVSPVPVQTWARVRSRRPYPSCPCGQPMAALVWTKAACERARAHAPPRHARYMATGRPRECAQLCGEENSAPLERERPGLAGTGRERTDGEEEPRTLQEKKRTGTRGS